MKKFALTLIAMAALSGCADRGKCLKSHPADIYNRVPGFDGTGNFFIEKHTVTICDQWEFPDGKPKDK